MYFEWKNDVVPRGNGPPQIRDEQRRFERVTSSGSPRLKVQLKNRSLVFPPPSATPESVAGDAKWRRRHRTGLIGGRVAGKHCRTGAGCKAPERCSPNTDQRTESHPKAAHTTRGAPGGASEGYSRQAKSRAPSKESRDRTKEMTAIRWKAWTVLRTGE